MQQPANTRKPTLKEWKHLKRTQQYSGVYQIEGEFGEFENVWFDVTAEAPTE